MHIYLSHVFNTIINIQASINHFRISETTTQSHCLAQLLAQAEGSRSSEPPSPRRGLEKGRRSSHRISLRRDPSRLGETFARSKIERVAWATCHVKRVQRVPVHLA